MHVTVMYNASGAGFGNAYSTDEYEDFDLRVEKNHNDDVSILFVFPKGSKHVSGHLTISSHAADWLGYALLKQAREAKSAGDLRIAVKGNHPKKSKRASK